VIKYTIFGKIKKESDKYLSDFFDDILEKFNKRLGTTFKKKIYE